jgi:hypothetical protein
VRRVLVSVDEGKSPAPPLFAQGQLCAIESDSDTRSALLSALTFHPHHPFPTLRFIES